MTRTATMHRLLISLSILGACTAAEPATAVKNLVENGDFTVTVLP